MKKQVFVGIGVLIGLLVLAVGVRVIGARRSYAGYLAKLEAEGELLTSGDINAQRQPVTPGRTVVDVIHEASDLLEQAEQPDRELLLGALGNADTSFFTGIDQNAITPTREFLAGQREVIELLGTTTALPPGRFDIPLANVGSGASIVPVYSTVRHVSKLTSTYANLKLIDGNVDTALDTIRVETALSSPLAEEPFLIAYLVHLAVLAQPIRLAENALNMGEIEDARLIELDGDLAQIPDQLPIKWALLGERSAFIRFTHGPQRQTNTRTDIIDALTAPRAAIKHLKAMGELIELHDQPRRLFEAAKEYELKVDQQSGVMNIFASQNAIGVAAAARLRLRLIAEVRLARTAIAAERYRLAHADLPTSLDDLVPAFLPEIPLDPFTEKPIKLKLVEKGLHVYSVGSDGIDDGGDFVHEEGEKRPPDVGFRLHDVEHRGLKLLPADTQEEAAGT